MKHANKLAWLNARGEDVNGNSALVVVEGLYADQVTKGLPPKILFNMDQAGFTADWDAEDRWFWRGVSGIPGVARYTSFPAMLRDWEKNVWPGLISKIGGFLPRNALTLLRLRGYDFKVEGNNVRVSHGPTMTLEEGKLDQVVERYIYASIEEKPAPIGLVEFNAAGYEMNRSDKNRWHWYGKGYTSEWFDSYEEAVDDWCTRRAAGKLDEDLPKAGTPSETDVRLNALQHYIEDGHRSAARENLPANISVAPDAKVKIAYGDNGRVLGCYVEATIFVSLAPTKA